MRSEPLPLAKIQEAVLQFLRGRKDAVVFGAHAVNAYVDEPRMTQDIDILSNRPEALAEELRKHLSTLFHIAVRVRIAGGAKGFRLYQVRKSGSRHLVDIRLVDPLPHSKRIANVQVLAPAELIAAKVVSYYSRRGKPKSGTDWRDIAMLLLKFPELKRSSGPVTEMLEKSGSGVSVLKAWQKFVGTDFTDEDENF